MKKLDSFVERREHRSDRHVSVVSSFLHRDNMCCSYSYSSSRNKVSDRVIFVFYKSFGLSLCSA